MKVVIDTNIAVSGLLWHGLPNKILKLARNGHIEICCSQTILNEFMRVVKYKKFKKRIEELGHTEKQVIDYYQDIVSLFPENSTIDVIKDDDSDNRFIETAIDSDANIIVSGDEHLLEIKEYKTIVIMTAHEFLQLHKELTHNDQ